MIDHPIAINDILRKCRANNYSTVKEFITDWELMFTNAKKYNGKKSWIAADASTIGDELHRLMKKNNIVEEPELPKKKLRIKLSLKKLKQSEEKKETGGSATTAVKRKSSTCSSKGKKRQRKMHS